MFKEREVEMCGELQEVGRRKWVKSREILRILIVNCNIRIRNISDTSEFHVSSLRIILWYFVVVCVFSLQFRTAYFQSRTEYWTIKLILFHVSLFCDLSSLFLLVSISTVHKLLDFKIYTFCIDIYVVQFVYFLRNFQNT